MVERLNDLTGTEWLPSTRSAFVDGVDDLRNTLTWDRVEAEFGSIAVVSTATARPKNKKLHPATFAESDAKRLVRMFTREGGKVLDPFVGSGSTALACVDERRACIGFELYEKWTAIARERIRERMNGMGNDNPPVDVFTVNAIEGVRRLPDESQDFILTSPPYWGILAKKDHKANKERAQSGLDTDYGSDPNDLSLIGSYDSFLDALTVHFGQWHRVLAHRRYVAVTVSDFRHGKRYFPFHAHVADRWKRLALPCKE